MKRLLSGVVLVGCLSIAGCFGGDSEENSTSSSVDESLTTQSIDTAEKKEEIKQPEGPKLVANSKVVIKSVAGFQNPESVVYDKARSQFFVSQANFSKDSGGGTISIIDGDGVVTDAKFITGLDHPKGLGVFGDKLYVADETVLVVIDIPSKKVVKRHAIDGALFLNDVAVDEKGAVFVSDTLTNQITRLSPEGEISVWLKDEALLSPNGLLFHEGALYVASWGVTEGTDVSALTNALPEGRLLKVSLDDKKITVLSSGPVGNLDGLVVDGDGNFYVTDWVSGKLFHMDSDGVILKTYEMGKLLGLESSKGLADIAFVADKKQIWAPMMLSGSVKLLNEVELKAIQ